MLFISPQIIRRKLISCGLCFLIVSGLTLTVIAGEKAELVGRIEMRTVDCFHKEAHVHDHVDYLLLNEKTDIQTKLLGKEEILKQLKPHQKIRVKGTRKSDPKKAKSSGTRAENDAVAGSGGDFEVESIEIVNEPEAEKASAPIGTEAAEGAPALIMLRCLLVFASSTDFACAVNETKARGKLFDNPTNANLGMQAITKGHYGLQLGNGSAQSPIVNLQLNVSSVGKTANDMETLMKTALTSAGYDRNDYDRVLLFPPAGIQSFTAYAYFNAIGSTATGLISVYGASYGNDRMNGYLHELGHNFGFHHSSKGTSEYGDRTCVMGLSNDATRTETYNVAKLLETNWLTPYTSSSAAISSDTTLNLYPLHTNPNQSSDLIAVSISGSPYYVAYHKNNEPYGYLSQTGDRDRLFVYTKESGSYQKSFQVANLGPGQSYTAGSSVISFELYGASNTFATVSLDLADGNTKPVANNQSVSAIINTPLPVTLSGTDADANPLTYAVVSNPSQGTLSGTAPNLTYTPPNNYAGVTNFQFLVNDGKISSFGVITITVSPQNTAPPVVYAGSDQSAVFSNSAAWTPANIATTGWYDASDANTITSIGGSVSVWSDKKGNGLNLGQGTLDLQPKTGINTINGLTTIKFDGSNDTLVTGSNPFAPTISDGFVIAVHRIDTTSTTGTLFSLSGSSATSGRWQAHVPYSGTAYFDTGGTSGVNRVSNNYGVVAGDNVLVGFYGSTTDSLQQIFKNGALLIGDATGHSVGTVGNISVGSSAATQYQNTSIGELLIIKGTVSVENRQKLEGYLAHKWGLAVNLPADHPHKAVPPGGSGGTVNLDGTVTDLDGNTLVNTWTKISGPGAVTFGNASLVDTTASFTEVGTYVLRLTANDGLYTTFDEVTISITSPTFDSDGNGIADVWEIQYFGASGLIDGSGDDDSDGVLDFFEYLYGSDPTDVADGGFRFAADANQVGNGVVFRWEVLEGFTLGTHYDVRISTNLATWNPIPAEHFSLQQTPNGTRTQLELTLTHDYGQRAFLRIIKP